MDSNTKNLINGLIRYKYLNKFTNPILGSVLKIDPSYVSQIVNFRTIPSISVLYRIEDLLRAWEENKAVSNESKKHSEKPKVQKDKTAKVVVDRKVKNKLVNKVSHKIPPKKRSRIS